MRKKRQKQRKKRVKLTMTKRLTYALLIIGVIGGLLPYVLAFLDKQPVESIGIAWITEIVAVCLGYFVRGFKDSQASEQMAFDREMAGLEMSALYAEDHCQSDDDDANSTE